MFIGASGFQTSIFSGWCSTSSASIASWATSGIVGWWTRLTSPFINSKVELWISWPAFPWFCKWIKTNWQSMPQQQLLWHEKKNSVVTLSISMGSAWMSRTIHSNRFFWWLKSSPLSLNFPAESLLFRVRDWKRKLKLLKATSIIREWWFTSFVITCIIRKGVWAIYPWVTLFRVSVNMDLSSDDLLYTKSICGHHGSLGWVIILQWNNKDYYKYYYISIGESRERYSS